MSDPQDPQPGPPPQGPPSGGEWGAQGWSGPPDAGSPPVPAPQTWEGPVAGAPQAGWAGTPQHAVGPSPVVGRVDVPLHPLLPGGGPQQQQQRPRPLNAHHQPHAASAGPADGARGAKWFAIGMALLVVLCVLGFIAIVGS